MLLWKPPIDGELLEPLLDGHPPPAATGSLVEESEPFEPRLRAGRHPSHLGLGIRPPGAAGALAGGADTKGIPESDLDAGVTGEETPAPAWCIVGQRLGGGMRWVDDDSLELMGLVVAERGVHGLVTVPTVAGENIGGGDGGDGGGGGGGGSGRGIGGIASVSYFDGVIGAASSMC